MKTWTISLIIDNDEYRVKNQCALTDFELRGHRLGERDLLERTIESLKESVIPKALRELKAEKEIK